MIDIPNAEESGWFPSNTGACQQQRISTTDRTNQKLTLLSSQHMLWKMSFDIWKYHREAYMAEQNLTIQTCVNMPLTNFHPSISIIIRIIPVSLFTYWGHDKIAMIAQTTYSNAFF